MSLSTLTYWIVIIIALAVCRVIITFHSRRKQQLKLEDFLKIITSSYAIVAAIRIIYKVVTSHNLMNLLGDDTITLFVGAFVLIWLSIKESLKISI